MSRKKRRKSRRRPLLPRRIRQRKRLFLRRSPRLQKLRTPRPQEALLKQHARDLLFRRPQSRRLQKFFREWSGEIAPCSRGRRALPQKRLFGSEDSKRSNARRKSPRG